MFKHVQDMSEGELRQIAFPQRRLLTFGRLWMLLPLFVVTNLVQCAWATQYHSNETYLGIPMNIVWVWFSIVITMLGVMDLGIANAWNTRQTQALAELIARTQIRP